MCVAPPQNNLMYAFTAWRRVLQLEFPPSVKDELLPVLTVLLQLIDGSDVYCFDPAVTGPPAPPAPAPQPPQPSDVAVSVPVEGREEKGETQPSEPVVTAVVPLPSGDVVTPADESRPAVVLTDA